MTVKIWGPILALWLLGYSLMISSERNFYTYELNSICPTPDAYGMAMMEAAFIVPPLVITACDALTGYPIKPALRIHVARCEERATYDR